MSAQKSLNQLARFYLDMQEWIDAGCPKDNPYDFWRESGICGNLTRWAGNNFRTIQEIDNLMSALKIQFVEAGLDEIYPFYTESPFDALSQYGLEVRTVTLYKNPTRLEWIAKHAAAAATVQEK